MRGHAADGIALAHEDSWAGPGASDTLVRQAREDGEHEHLAPLATRSSGSGDRVLDEEPDPFRTCFERDRVGVLDHPLNHGVRLRERDRAQCKAEARRA